jgi:hypothetical protein
MIAPVVLLDSRSNTGGMGWAVDKIGEGLQCVGNTGKLERKYFRFGCERQQRFGLKRKGA